VRLVAELAEESAKLKVELQSAKQNVAELQLQFQRNVKALHAECIFLETEIKEQTEQHERTIAAVNKSKAASFFAAKEEWTARLQRYAVDKQQELLALENKINLSVSTRRSAYENELSQLELKCKDCLERTEVQTLQTIETLHATHRQLELRMEAWRREAATFLSRYRATELSYRGGFERITAALHQETKTHDFQLLQDLLESQNRRSDAVYQLAQRIGVPSDKAKYDLNQEKKGLLLTATKSPVVGTQRPSRVISGPTRSPMINTLPAPKSRSPAASSRIRSEAPRSTR